MAPQLDRYFALFGDELEATGTTPGIADEKVGDFIVTLNPHDTGGRDRRIVFELKKRKTRSSVQSCLAELDRAMLNPWCPGGGHGRAQIKFVVAA